MAPVEHDMNDMMVLRLWKHEKSIPYLVKGESMTNPIAFYQIHKGQDYTAWRGINFYLIFIATEDNSGEFTFGVKYYNVNGPGKEVPTEVTWEVEPQDPDEIGKVDTKSEATDPESESPIEEPIGSETEKDKTKD